MADKIPTVRIGAPIPDKKAKVKKAKFKAKVKAKAKAKAPKLHGKRFMAKARLDQVPAALAPPVIEDTRPQIKHHKRGHSYEEVVQGQAPVTEEDQPSATQTSSTSISGPSLVKPAPQPSSFSADHRPVQGATCTWIGTMGEAVDDDNGVPTCPHCKGHLLTVAGGRENMELGFESYELGAYTAVNPAPRPHPGYRGLMYWVLDQSQVRCWPTPEEAAEEYYGATGKRVDPRR